MTILDLLCEFWTPIYHVAYRRNGDNHVKNVAIAIPNRDWTEYDVKLVEPDKAFSMTSTLYLGGMENVLWFDDSEGQELFVVLDPEDKDCRLICKRPDYSIKIGS